MFSRNASAVLMAMFGLSVAQAQPDSGSLLRDTENSLPTIEQQPNFLPELPAELPDTGMKISLTEVQVSGYEGMTTEAEIQKITDLYLNKKLGFKGLNRIADLITAHLKSKGFFLAFAYLPQQDISTGILQIRIQPGRLDGSVNLNYKMQDDQVEPFIDQDFVQETLAYRIGDSEGTLLHAQKIEDAILTINDFAGIVARMNLQKGSTRGTTQVDVNLAETDKYNGVVWVDNQGGYYTGRERMNGLISFNNLANRGDAFSVMLSRSAYQTYGRVNYEIPVHPSGLKMNVAFTGLDYELGNLENSEATGQSMVWSLGATYPIKRSRAQNWYLNAKFDRKALEDEAGLGSAVRERTFNNITLAIRGNYSDRFLKGAYSNMRLALISGNLNRSQADNFDTEGRFSKLNFSFSRLQRFNTQWTAMASFKGQLASTNLDSAEKFSATGPYGVRAYASGDASGDHGILATLEGRYNLPKWNYYGSSLQLKAFADAGRVSLSKDGFDGYIPANTNEVNTYSVAAVGIGAILRKADTFELSTLFAQQFNPDINDRTVTGLDSEGKDQEFRFWLQAKAWF